jgi:hypothetical protein
MGEGDALAAVEAPVGPRLLGIPRWRIRLMVRLAASSTVRALARRPGAFEGLLDCVHAAGVTWGQLKRAARQRRMRGVTVGTGAGGGARAVRAPR